MEIVFYYSLVCAVVIAIAAAAFVGFVRLRARRKGARNVKTVMPVWAGRDGRYDPARIAKALDGADIIALQEVERNWPRTAMADQTADLAARH